VTFPENVSNSWFFSSSSYQQILQHSKAKSIENINIPEPVTILVFNFERATVHFIRQAP